MRVLHLYTELSGGGVERFLLNYYTFMDRDKICFDIIVPGNDIGILEKDFLRLGGQVFHVERIRDNIFLHLTEVYKIIKRGNYDIVHCHGYRSIDGLILSFLCNVKVRIIHSHMAYEKESFLKKCTRRLVAEICKIFSTDRYACGLDAGIWLFGKNDYKKEKFRVVHNAIDLKKYQFNPCKRHELRTSLGVEGKMVIGNVARLSYQKNHEFLIKVFKQISIVNSNAVLIIAGGGELETQLKEMCVDEEIQDKVIFLGTRDDVPDLLSVFDVFVLTSHYEGLPVSLVEVQAAGLYGVISDSITKEVNVTNRLHYISLKEDVANWVERIIQAGNMYDRNAENMQGGVYDIRVQAPKLQEEYFMLLNRMR